MDHSFEIAHAMNLMVEQLVCLNDKLATQNELLERLLQGGGEVVAAATTVSEAISNMSNVAAQIDSSASTIASAAGTMREAAEEITSASYRMNNQ